MANDNSILDNDHLIPPRLAQLAQTMQYNSIMTNSARLAVAVNTDDNAAEITEPSAQDDALDSDLGTGQSNELKKDIFHARKYRSGGYCSGKTPMQIFLDSKYISL